MDEEINLKTISNLMESDNDDSIQKIVYEEFEVDDNNLPALLTTTINNDVQLCKSPIADILTKNLNHKTDGKKSSTDEDDDSVDDEENNSSLNDDEEYVRSTSSSCSSTDYGDYDENSSSNCSFDSSIIENSLKNCTEKTVNNNDKSLLIIKTTKEENNKNEMSNKKNELIRKNSSDNFIDKQIPVKIILKNSEQNKIIVTDENHISKSQQSQIITTTSAPNIKQRVLQAKISQNKLLLVTLVDSIDSKVIDTKNSGEQKNLAGPANLIVSNSNTNVTKYKEDNLISKNINESEDTKELKMIEKNKSLIATTNEIWPPSAITTIVDDLINLENEDNIPSRTSTPKMKRELLQLQKTVTESKILTEYMHDSSTQKSRKTRKIVPLKHGDEISIESKSSASRRSRSRSCSKAIDEHDNNNIGNRVLGKWKSDEKLNKQIVSSNSKKIKTSKNLRDENTSNSNRESLTTTIHSYCSTDNNRRDSSVYDGDSIIGDCDKSLDKWASDEKLNKRTMRSQNLDFVQKQIKFLSRVNQDGDLTDHSDTEISVNNDTKLQNSTISNQLHVVEKTYEIPEKNGADGFCWKCHSCGNEMISCIKCPRSFHYKCLKLYNLKSEKDWMCVECVHLDNFVKTSIKSGKSNLSQDHLNQLLQFALNRAKLIKGHEYFVDIRNESECPDYKKYIKHPVTLKYLQDKVTEKFFNTSEEFYAEAKWIQHNAFCYYGSNNKITNVAKSLVKVCRQEVNEIETCAECYLNANTRNDWFVEVCAKPHIILWAKLKGFPYWPAKAMGFNPPTLVNVRFFGDHDRANVSIKECYLYSEANPNPATKQRTSKNSIAECIKEVDIHIEKLKLKFGNFNYAPFKTIYDPYQEITQLELMLPGVTDYLKTITVTNSKRPLTFKIVKTADNNLSMIKKFDENTTKPTINTNQLNTPSIKICNINLTTTVTTPTVNAIQTTSTINLNINKNENLSNNTNNKPSLIIQKISNISENHSKSAKSNIPVHSLESGCKITTTLNTSNEYDLDKNSIDNNEISTESYEVISKGKDSPVDIKKIQSLVIKRRYDNLNTSNNLNDISPSTTINKKIKNDLNVENILEDEKSNLIKTTISESVSSVTVLTSKATTSTTAKRKRSDNENSLQPEKKQQLIKLNENENNQCPPLILLNQQQSTGTIPDTTKISISSSNSGVIITPTTNINTTVSLMSSTNITTSTTSIVSVTTTSANSKSKTPNIDNLIKNNKSVTITRISTKEIMSQPQQESVDLNKRVYLFNHNIKEKIDNDISENKNILNKTTSQTIPKIINRNKSSNSNINKSITTITTTQSKLISSNIFPVPFIEIKTEKLDNITADTIGTKNRVKSLEFVEQTSPINDAVSSQQINQTSLSAIMPIPQNIEIKTEITSDNEDQSTENSNIISINQALNTDTLTTNSIQNLQRISVRQFATIPTVQQIISQKTIEYHPQKKDVNSIIAIQKTSQQKELQRARKSFPNKALQVQPILPLSINQINKNSINSNTSFTNNSNNKILNKNLNNMVYIPMDIQNEQQQQKSIPVPPLTAVTKINNQSKFSLSNSNTANNNSTNKTTIITTTAPSFHLDNNTLNNNFDINNSLSNTLSSVTNTTPIIVNHANNNSSNNDDTSDHMLSGFVTQSLAAAITDTIVRGPPKLAPRPNGPMQSDGDYVYPVEAGPVSRTLMENAHKMTDFFRSVIEDTIGDMTSNGLLEAKIIQLQLEIERLKNLHDKELNELKQNTDLMLCEMRNSIEKEKSRIIIDTRKQCEIERIRSIDEVKKKQWCAMCGKEAQFYCCWNVSYCDYPCQQKHWPRHMSNCGQSETNHNATGIGATSGNIGQKIGVKISPYNVKDKSLCMNKNKELTSMISGISGNSVNSNMTIPLRMPITSSYIRSSSIPMQRNPSPISIPIQRFNIPLPLSAAPNTAPPYTLINREGNWELMGAPANALNFQSRIIIPTTGSILVNDSTGKCITTNTNLTGMLKTVMTPK